MADKSGVSAKWEGLEDIKYSLMLLQMTEREKKRAMGQIARGVRVQTRKNIKKQSSVTGKKFKERNRKRTLKGKMLSGLSKDKNFYTKITQDSALVTWKGPMAGVAKVNQEGMAFTMNSQRKISKQKLEEMKGLAALEWQAKLMNKLGFLVANPERKGKRGPSKKDGKEVVPKPVSKDWIMENITAYQAMIIIAALREKRGEKGSGKSVRVKLPAREFFPNERAWLNELATRIVTQEYRKAGK